MATRDKNIYGALNLASWLDSEALGTIADNILAQYNNSNWKKYGTWGTPSNSTKWSQAVKDDQILVKASILGVNSPKPQRNTAGWSVYGGSMPKLGHGLSINEDDLMVMREVQNLTGTPYQELVLDTLTTNLTNLLGGINASLNSFVYEALSTGAIHQASLDGVSYDLIYRTKENHHISLTKPWWSISNDHGVRKYTPDPSATVIQDIIEVQNAMDRDNMVFDHWKISKALYTRLLAHPAVIAACTARANVYQAANYILTENEKLNYIHECGVLPFDVIDEKSAIEEDGVAKIDKASFDEDVMTLCPTGNLFEMKCANSIYKDGVSMGWGDDANIYSFVEGGAIAILQSYYNRPMQAVTDVELWAVPVMKNPNNIAFLTTVDE